MKYTKDDLLVATSSLIRNYDTFKSDTESALTKITHLDRELSRLEVEANKLSSGAFGFGNKKKKELQELENIRKNIYEARSLYTSNRSSSRSSESPKKRSSILPLVGVGLLSLMGSLNEKQEIYDPVDRGTKVERQYDQKESIPVPVEITASPVRSLRKITLEEVASAPEIIEVDEEIKLQAVGYVPASSSKKSKTYISDEVETQGIICTAILHPRSMIDGSNWSKYRGTTGIRTTKIRLFQELERISNVANSSTTRELAKVLSSAYDSFSNQEYDNAIDDFERVREILDSSGTIDSENSWVGLDSGFYSGLSRAIGSYISQAQELKRNPSTLKPLVPRHVKMF